MLKIQHDNTCYNRLQLPCALAALWLWLWPWQPKPCPVRTTARSTSSKSFAFPLTEESKNVFRKSLKKNQPVRGTQPHPDTRVGPVRAFHPSVCAVLTHACTGASKNHPSRFTHGPAGAQMIASTLSSPLGGCWSSSSGVCGSGGGRTLWRRISTQTCQPSAAPVSSQTLTCTQPRFWSSCRPRGQSTSTGNNVPEGQ